MKTKTIQHTAALITFVLVVCLVYANSFHDGFHFDDYHTIVNNPAIQSLHNIPHFFTNAKTFSILPANQTYRPIVSTTLAFDYWLGNGLKPFYFHIGTFVIYLLQLLAMVLFFRITLNRMRPERDYFLPAAFAAAWYGLHPAMTGTVDYIIQRGDVYVACGVVFAMLIYVALPRWRRYGLYLAPFVLALLSKPPAIVFPALLFAWLAMFEAPAETRYRYAAWRAVPSLIVGIAVMALEGAMTPKSFTPSTLSNFSWYITQPYVLLREFYTFFLPLHLNVDTDLKAFPHLNALAIAGFAFLIVLIAAIVLLIRNRQTRPIAFGLLWFLVGALPTALYKLSEAENDHRLFLPFIGMALACTWTGYLGLEWLAQRIRPRRVWRTGTACALLMLCAYGWAAHIRNIVWHSNLSLWYDDVLKSPHNGRGLMNYGLAQMDAGHDQIALHYFEQALQYTPNYPTLEINLGIVNGLLADQGQPARAAQAQQHFLRAIALAPADGLPHAYYGRWLLDHGRTQEAVQQLRLAVQLNPQAMMQRNLLMVAEQRDGNNAAFWINQSLAEYQRGQYMLAIASAQHALTLDPHSAEAYNNIGAANAALHRWRLAVDADHKALALKPDFTLARNNLAWARSHLHDAP